ncbi:MAG: SpoIIE family protein phosphatase [Bacteroidetes bacterium]|nr:SpoIIE family protein phosphatase [Bacteroidota bacterium]
MDPVRDTAKQDLLLIVAGLVSILLSFWLYSDFHPLPAADISLGEEQASEKAKEIANDIGFESDLEPLTIFQTDPNILDSLQKQTDFQAFYDNPLHKRLYPSFYWQSDFQIRQGEDEGGIFDGMDENQQLLSVRLNESGEWLALLNGDNYLPQNMMNADALLYGAEEDSSLITGWLNGDVGPEDYRFELEDAQRQRRDGVEADDNGLFLLGTDIAERIAGYYLEQSGWPEKQFDLSSVENVTLGEVEAAQVKFTGSLPNVRQIAEVNLTVLPGGGLVSMTYEHTEEDDESLQEIVAGGMRAITYTVAAFWIIILLFIRFRLRLVDLKISTLVAVLGGLILPFVLFLQLLYDLIHSFTEISLSSVVPQVIGIGFTAAFSSLGFFAVTALADSVTRQNWSEKLKTIDLIRVGYFLNVPLGVNIVRGISYGLIGALIWSLVLYLLPNSYVSLQSSFLSDETFVANVSLLLENLALSYLVVAVIFCIFIGQLHSATRSGILIVAVAALLYVLGNPFPVQTGPFWVQIASLGALGAFLGFLYFKEDFLTLFLAVFVLLGFQTTANGWLVEGSPDSFIFYSFIFVLIGGYIFGAYNILRGAGATDLPSFVPEYIQELAREDRIKQELSIAREVQQSFLPAHTPDIKGYEVAAVCRPAYETGGDYYDIISLNDDNVAITIGDVSGKGIQAAFYMTFIKGVLHALCTDYRSTIQTLINTNSLFRKNAGRGTFISLIYGILDLKNEHFRFSRAGHNPLLYFKHSEKKLYEFRPEGLAIGMVDEELFGKKIREEIIQLESNDILILFTDGVVESLSASKKLYGDKRLHNIIQRNYKVSPSALLKKIEDDLAEFANESDQHDDLTMIIIKKT